MSVLECRDILKILPHRPPFLLVDRILEIKEGESAVGIKNVTMNEPFFTGHFPGNPIMPGVLIVEALAQVGAVAILSMAENKEKLALFTGIDKLKFRRQVVPGDVLRLEATLTAFRRGIGKATAVALVGEKMAASGELSFALVDK